SWRLAHIFATLALAATGARAQVGAIDCTAMAGPGSTTTPTQTTSSGKGIASSVQLIFKNGVPTVIVDQQQALNTVASYTQQSSGAGGTAAKDSMQRQAATYTAENPPA